MYKECDPTRIYIQVYTYTHSETLKTSGTSITIQFKKILFLDICLVLLRVKTWSNTSSTH
jgi:hypothetical protein